MPPIAMASIGTPHITGRRRERRARARAGAGGSAVSDMMNLWLGALAPAGHWIARYATGVATGRSSKTLQWT